MKGKLPLHSFTLYKLVAGCELRKSIVTLSNEGRNAVRKAKGTHFEGE